MEDTGESLVWTKCRTSRSTHVALEAVNLTTQMTH